MSQETWILNGTLVTQDAERRILKAHLRIVDDRIVEIRESKGKKSLPPLENQEETQIIEANGETIFPGFVQAHVHLCQTLFRNQADDLSLLPWLEKRIWPLEAAHTPETLYASALLGIYELLGSGSTCLLDMASTRHTESVLEAVRQSGIRANVGHCLMDDPQYSPPSLCQKTSRALDEATQLLSTWQGRENDRIRVSYAPRFVLSCSEELLKAVAQLSQQHGILLHTHANENPQELEQIRQKVGCDNLEYLERLGLTEAHLVLAHCVWLNPQEIEILKRSHSFVVHCPAANLKLASGLAPVPELREKGVTVALGSDGAPCNNNLNMLQEMRLAALVHKPSHNAETLKAQEILDMATLEGARALDWDRHIGSIEEGKKADLTSFDLRQPENLHYNRPIASLVYSSQAQHLQWSMVDGEKVFEQGSLSRITTYSLMQQAEKALKALRSQSRLS